MSSDDERGSQISDIDMDEEQVSGTRLEHFKATYDQNWDYPAIAESLFDGAKVLVQKEKASSNPHVHFQGYTTLAPRTFTNKMGMLATTHYRRMEDPKSRPVSRVKRAVDEKGFQYMMKEGHAPLYQRGFTEEELAQLAASSKEHVDKMKTSVRDYVRELKIEPHMFTLEHRFDHLFDNTWLQAVRYVEKNDKAPSQFTRKDTAHGLRMHPNCSDAFLMWMGRNNKF